VRFYNRLKIKRVIIYGLHSEDWHLALSPNSKVWKLLPSVGKVFAVDGLPECLPKKKIFFKDYIIPLLENHISATPDSRTSLKPRLELLEKFANKKKFNNLLIELSLSQYQPEHYSDETIIKYPVVLKRTDLNAAKGMKIIFTKDELIDSLSQDMWRDNEFIIQEFIESTSEFACHAVYKDGIRLWDTTIKYFKSDTLVLIGSETKIKSTHIESSFDALKVFDEIMLKTKYSGPCNIDYSYQSSDLKIFEINPRLGGSLMKTENVKLLAQALTAIIKAA